MEFIHACESDYVFPITWEGPCVFAFYLGASKYRLSLFDEGGDTLAVIVALGAIGKAFRFQLQLTFEFVLQRAIHQTLAMTKNLGRAISQAAG